MTRAWTSHAWTVPWVPVRHVTTKLTCLGCLTVQDSHRLTNRFFSSRGLQATRCSRMAASSVVMPQYPAKHRQTFTKSHSL